MLYAEICPNVRRHNARPEGKGNVDAVVCPNNGQFQVGELNI
jgi:hypothetical protein